MTGTTRPRRRGRALATALLVPLTAALAAAQSVSPVGGPGPEAPLADFTGVYAYRNGATVAVVPKRQDLIAIIDDALYTVTRVRADEFKNGAGQPVRFRRGPEGGVIGLLEVDDFFPRLSTTIPARVAALIDPRSGRDPAMAEYRYAAPARLGDGLEVGEAAAARLDPALLAGLAGAILDERHPNVHSVLLWRDGRLVFEEYFYGYDRDATHQLRSATKSVISLLVGIAMGEGLLRGPDQPLLDLLPWPRTSYANPDPRKATITLGDLLSMRTGLACDDRDPQSPGGERVLYSTPDWAKFTMDLPMVAVPGTVARYCSGGAHLAGRVVEHASGRDLLSYARARLFGPLGFGEVAWPFRLEPGNANTFAQVYLRPRDMLKLGIVILDGGAWQGRQVVPRDWVERATAPLTTIGSKPYGYLWWRQSFPIETSTGPVTVETILATGNGGQKIFVVPSLRLVAVFTGGNYNASTDTPPNDIMGRLILPALVKAPDATR